MLNLYMTSNGKHMYQRHLSNLNLANNSGSSIPEFKIQSILPDGISSGMTPSSGQEALGCDSAP